MKPLGVIGVDLCNNSSSPLRDSLLDSNPEQGCKCAAYLWLPEGMGETGKYSLETKM